MYATRSEGIWGIFAGAHLNGALVPTFHSAALSPILGGLTSTRRCFWPFSSFTSLILNRRTSNQARLESSVAHLGTRALVHALVKHSGVRSDCSRRACAPTRERRLLVIQSCEYKDCAANAMEIMTLLDLGADRKDQIIVQPGTVEEFLQSEQLNERLLN